MTTEERARRYDEAIEKAKGVIEQNPLMEYLKKGIEYIFPELKESEDEKIRKGIIRNLEYLMDRAEWFVKDELKERIAWLEKQGENNMGISEATKQKLEDNLKEALEKETPESCNEFLDEQGEQKPVFEMKTPGESLGIDSDTYNKIVDDCIYDEQKPAETVKWSPQEESCICQLESLVKEQWRQADKVHNSVNIKKMSELMFFLKTLNPNKKPQRIISAEVKEAMYDKPAWSEEDEKMLKACTVLMGNTICANYGEEDGVTVDACHNWLKSIKGRIQSQLKKELSDDDEKMLEHIISDLKEFRDCEINEELISDYEEEIHWLKSLRPQNTWKPSDEQMLAISTAIGVLGKGTINGQYLIELHEQLLKLKD